MLKFYAKADGVTIRDGQIPVVKLVGTSYCEPANADENSYDTFCFWNVEFKTVQSEIYVSARAFGLVDIGKKKFEVTIREVDDEETVVVNCGAKVVE